MRNAILTVAMVVLLVQATPAGAQEPSAAPPADALWRFDTHG